MNADKRPGWALSGSALLAQIRKTRLPQEMLAFWFLGQAGMVVKHGDFIAVIDPYLEDVERRQIPVPFRPEEFGGVDAVLCTHDHSDHLNDATIRGMAMAPGNEKTRFIVPRSYVQRALDLGVPAGNIIGAAAGESFELTGAAGAGGTGPQGSGTPGVRILPVASAHESFETDANGDHLYLGYLLEFVTRGSEGEATAANNSGATAAAANVAAAPTCQTVRVYHSGDTVEWESMAADLASLHPTVMMLPINGSDWHRKHMNIIGNLDPREAADVADSAGADLVIPLHYDMFAGNGEEPGHFAYYMYHYHPGKKYHIMTPGERFIYLCDEN